MQVMENLELIHRVLELERLVRNLRNEMNSWKRSSENVPALLQSHRKADVDFCMFPRHEKRYENGQAKSSRKA